ncbi:hypothetical protein MMAD_46660 [Mycolicibacterium madagascariense]|uniref:Uncharacterized protein n=1 Tax=Mycolicibacterium madagascariense TaxID=212765 RepID=A0A7I7XMB5_9MYCO|nr:hypothetical protein [Mycolicibacterium madagascariense]MCV7013064.1 hypothetical protein [Mycolicibacterium madagascariense]BBZ30371.1 hypothetical protein MMAD_46660 [Mycolicibacterium madagascariense]
MPESTENIHDEVNRLTVEAERALLQQIIELAPKSGLGRIEEAARAFALVVGARPGVLPGGPLSVKS